MALFKTKGEMPKGAVRLTEKEAEKYQWKIIKEWPTPVDVWPFKYGNAVVAVGTALSSIYINNHYRRLLHLHNFGQISTYLPIVVLPSFLSLLYHQQAVTRAIILEKIPCPLCIELRAAGIQVLTSVVMPSILAPLSGFMFATRHYTYNLPPLTRPMEHLKLWQKLTRPIGNTLFFICILQAFLAMGITFFEQDSYMNIKRKLIEETRDL